LPIISATREVVEEGYQFEGGPDKDNETLINKIKTKELARV
jgi:hypothetical protein